MWTSKLGCQTSSIVMAFLLLPGFINAFKIQWSKASDERNENEILPNNYQQSFKYRSLLRPPTVSRSYNDWSLKKYLRTDDSYSSRNRYSHWRPVVRYRPIIKPEPPVEPAVPPAAVVEEEPDEKVVQHNMLDIEPSVQECSKLYCDDLECCSGICTNVFGNNLCVLLPSQYRRR